MPQNYSLKALNMNNTEEGEASSSQSGPSKLKRRSFLPSLAKPTSKPVCDPVESPRPEPKTPPRKQHWEPQRPVRPTVGDRVLINETKAGVLLYIGKTQFAQGEWCGIELDEAEGKHDGKIHGIRYFVCKAGHGILAPVDRVQVVKGAKRESPSHEEGPDKGNKLRRVHNQTDGSDSDSVTKPRSGLPTPKVSRIGKPKAGTKHSAEPRKVGTKSEIPLKFIPIRRTKSAIEPRKNSKTEEGGPRVQGVVSDSALSRSTPPGIQSVADIPLEEQEAVVSNPSSPDNESSLHGSDVTGGDSRNLPELDSEPSEKMSCASGAAGELEDQGVEEELALVEEHFLGEPLLALNDQLDQELFVETADDNIPGVPEEPAAAGAEGEIGEPEPDLGYEAGVEASVHAQTEQSGGHHEVVPAGLPPPLLDSPGVQEGPQSKPPATEPPVDLEDVNIDLECKKVVQLLESAKLSEEEECGLSDAVISEDQSDTKSQSDLIQFSESSDIVKTGVVSYQSGHIESQVEQETGAVKEGQTVSDLLDLSEDYQPVQIPDVKASSDIMSDSLDQKQLVGSDLINLEQSTLPCQYENDMQNVSSSVSSDRKTVLIDFEETTAVSKTSSDGPLIVTDLLDLELSADISKGVDVEDGHPVLDLMSDKVPNIWSETEHEENEIAYSSLCKDLQPQENIMEISTDSLDLMTKLDEDGTSDATLRADLEAGHSRGERPVSLVSCSSADTGIMGDMGSSVEAVTTGDVGDGSQRKERPLSILSTSSVDTGYQPDTDSEMGTEGQPLSPTGFHTEEEGVDAPRDILPISATTTTPLDAAYAKTFRNFQEAVKKGVEKAEQLAVGESDVSSEGGTVLAGSETDRDLSDLEDLMPSPRQDPKQAPDGTPEDDSDEEELITKEEFTVQTPTEDKGFDLPVDDTRTDMVENKDKLNDSGIMSMEVDITCNGNIVSETPQVVDTQIISSNGNIETSMGIMESGEIICSQSTHVHPPAVLENGVPYLENGVNGDMDNIMDAPDKVELMETDRTDKEDVQDVAEKDTVPADNADHVQSSEDKNVVELMDTELSDTEHANVQPSVEVKQPDTNPAPKPSVKEKGSDSSTTSITQGKTRQPAAKTTTSKKTTVASTVPKGSAKKPVTKVQSKVSANVNKSTSAKQTEGDTSTTKSGVKSLNNKRKSDASLHSTGDLPPGKKVANPKTTSLTQKKNIKNTRDSASPKGNPTKSSTSVHKTSTDSLESKEKKPPVKCNPPKSKWNNIMSQIDDNKTNGKADGKTNQKKEVKSKIGSTTSRTTKSTTTKTEPAKSTVQKPSRSSTPEVGKASLKASTKPSRGTSPDVSRSASRVSSVTDVTQPDTSPAPSISGQSPRGRPSTTQSKGIKPKQPSRSPSVGSDSQLSLCSQASIADQQVAAKRTSHPTKAQEASGIKRPATKRPSVTEQAASKIGKPKETRKSSITGPGGTTSQAAKAKKSSTAPVSSTTKKTTTKASDNRQGSKTAVKSTAEVKGSAEPKASSEASEVTVKPSHQPDVVVATIQDERGRRLSELEGLCETREKNLQLCAAQVRHNALAFSAMATLVSHMAHQLRAFECPLVMKRLQKTEEQLTDAHSQIGELMSEQSKLDEELSHLIHRHREEQERVEEEHRVEVASLQEEWREQTDRRMQKLSQKHAADYSELKEAHQKKVSALQTEHETQLLLRDDAHHSDLEKVKEEHQAKLKELQEQHESQLLEITKKFDTIKVTLHEDQSNVERVEMLRAECEEMHRREKMYMEQFQRESDLKVQVALRPYKHLPEENESLKAVLELKNQEVHELRRQKGELEKQLEQLPAARDKIRSLEQKVENLEAIVTIKADYEKQLAEKHQVLLRKLDRESKANKRLSMDNEELSWRLSQGETGVPDLFKRQMSHSPTKSEGGTSPDPRRAKTAGSDSFFLSASPPVTTRGSPPTSGKSNLRRSGTYDLLDQEDGKDDNT